MKHVARTALKVELEALFDSIEDASRDRDFSKYRIRRLYTARRVQQLRSSAAFLRRHLSEVAPFFADGPDLDPTAIQPRIERVEGNGTAAAIFRIATLFWSVPPSHGFGRRTRFLVWDSTNERVIGIFALGDPIFNLAARDNWIGWSSQDRMERLNLVADAFILGSLPPYSSILGGKLIASLLTTDEVVNELKEKYYRRRSLLERRPYRPPVLITTSSALGRSSIYNRVTLNRQRLMEPIGWTSGFGHFQISNDLFLRLRDYLRSEGHPYADGHAYGTGPNWRMRVIRASVSLLGLDADNFLNHGVRRQVYACPLAHNFQQILVGRQTRPRWKTESVEARAKAALERWVIPRAERRTEFREWPKERVLEQFQQLAANLACGGE